MEASRNGSTSASSSSSHKTPPKLEITVHSRESGVPIYATNVCPTFLSPTPSAPLRSEPVTGVKGAFVLYNVLSPAECQQFIDVTEKMGYADAPVTTMSGMRLMKDLRNNERVMWQSTEEVWSPIWQRIQSFMPQSLTLMSRTWSPYGLNERLRFYRYDRSQEFGRHYDGDFPRSFYDRSILTFIVYLTDDFEGGETTFYPSGVKVKPVQGMALLFQHGCSPLSPEHEGSLVTGGNRKYVFRSDVMYRADPSQKKQQQKAKPKETTTCS